MMNKTILFNRKIIFISSTEISEDSRISLVSNYVMSKT